MIDGSSPPGNRFGSFVATPPRFASVASSDFSPYPNPQNPIFKTTGEGSPTQVDFNQEILNGGCSLDDDCTGQGQLGSETSKKTSSNSSTQC